MRVLLINPPHSNPTGPTLGLAVLSSFIKANFLDVSSEIVDLSIKSFYYLLSAERLMYHREMLSQQIIRLESKKSLAYQDLLLLKKKHRAKQSIEDYGSDVEHYLEILKNSKRNNNPNERETAIMVINLLLESIGVAYPNHISFSAGDYRSKFSPFSTSDISEYINDKENPYYVFFEQWIEQFDMQDVLFVGISISFAKQMLPALQLANMIKKRHPSIFVQLGGSMMAHLKAKNFAPLFQYCNAIVQKEGEIPIYNILNKIIARKKLDSKDGAFFMDPRNSLSYPKEMQSIDVTKEKVPDFSTIKFNDYLVPFPVVPIQIGRTCYWGKCSFCCLNAAFAHQHLWHTAEQIIDYLQELVDRFHVSAFEFVDDAIPPRLANELSDGILAKGLSIQWFSYARFDSCFTKELLLKMRKAGCVGLKFGLESASPRVLELMNKGIDLHQVQRIVKDAAEVGLHCQVAFFVGFPTETAFDRELTLDFLRKNVIPFGGVLAFNGWFRILKDMPIIRDKRFCRKITKWNTSEDLIDYYMIDSTTFEDMQQLENMINKKLFKNIVVDYVRSVDRRRYWFSGLCSIKDYMWDVKKDITVMSHYDLTTIVEYRDKKFDDFRPGKGIYSTKSYISTNLLSDETASILNKTFVQRRGKLKAIKI